MIVVRINGGLGNQMFQYAFGLYLKKTKNSEVSFDNSSFFRKEANNFEVNKFNTNIKLVSGFTILKYGVKNNFFSKTVNVKSRNYYKENMPYTFDHKIKEITVDSYYDGYWQCENYFKEYYDDLKNEFSLKTESSQYLNLLNRLQNNNSVSIHIRRGDYLLKNNLKSFGICGLEYYYKAISFMKNKINNPKYIVFSDDPVWVENNLCFNNDYLNISKYKLNSYEELILMSKCKHNIIANSTFSWWAAWLNNYSDKIIIAPKQWRNDNVSIGDLLPVNWLKI